MNSSILFKKYLKILITIYIFTLSIQLWNFNYIRISEIVFIILIFYIIIGIFIRKFKISIILSDIIFLLFFISALILFFFNNFNLDYVFGIVITFYLFSIYFIFRNLLNIYDYNYFLKIILFSVFISSLIGILGWFLQQFEINNIFAFNYEYPLKIGKSARANGTFSTPTMLAIHIITCFIILISLKENFKYYKIFLSVYSICLLLTFSKSILILILIYLIHSLKKFSNKIFKILIFSSFIIGFLSQIFFTNILIVKNNERYKWLDERSDAYIPINANHILEINGYFVYMSMYGYLKLKNFEVIKENFPNGIGFRNFDNYKVEKYKNLPAFDPHSNYLGIISEFGILGLISLFILLFYLIKESRTYSHKKNLLFIYLFMIYILIESINTDLITFIIFWIFAAILVSTKQKQKIN